MAKQLPCPNPTCTHVFSAQEVQKADMLKCPRCGQSFRFRAPGAAPATAPAAPAKPAIAPAAPPIAKPISTKPTVPTATPVIAAKPMAPVAAPVAPLARPAPAPTSPGSVDVEALEQPVALPEPEADPFAIPSAPVVEDDTPLLRLRRPKKKGWTAKHYTILLLSVLVAGGLITGLLLFAGDFRTMFRRYDDDAGASARTFHVRNQAGKDEKAFRLAAPERWSVHKDLRTRFGALTAWHSNESDAWFAIAVQDYGQQRPRDSELMKNAVERLEGHFGDALELANRPARSTLAGEECNYIRFKGTFNSVTWYGECYLLAHHGFGYWFFVATSSRWGGSEDATFVKNELEKSKSLAIVTDRKGWREQPPPMETFHAQSAPLSVSVPKGAWEKSAAKDIEETGELLLLGRFLREKDNRKNASLLVFTSDKKSDLKESLREARSYLEKRKQEENEKYKYMSVQEGGSESGMIGDHSGQQVELKLVHGDEPRRFALLSVVHHDDRAFVILCDCAWEHRQIWQQDFRNALATLKFSKKD